MFLGWSGGNVYQLFQLPDGLRRFRAVVLYRVQLVEEFPDILQGLRIHHARNATGARSEDGAP